MPKLRTTSNHVQNPFLRRNLSVLLLLSKQLAGVITPLRQSPSPNPISGRDLLGEAIESLRRGDLERVEHSCEAVLVRYPRCFDALRLLAIVSFRQDQHLAAIERIERAIAVDPSAAEPYCFRGAVLLALGRAEDAIASYDRALTLRCDDADAHNGRGHALFALGRYDEALGSFDRAVEIKCDHAEAHNNRGSALLALRRPDEALASYDRAVLLKPDFGQALFNRGNALSMLGRLVDAIASYDRAIRARPNYGEAFYNRGNALLRLGRAAEALTSYDEALAIDPRDPKALHNRGNALVELGRPIEALASYDRSVQFDPECAETFNSRGNVLLTLKRPAEALASYDRAIRLQPDYAEAFYNRGSALYNRLLGLSRSEEALASYDRAIALKPDYAEAYNNRGNVLRSLKRLDEAIESFNRAVRLRPLGSARYNRGLAELLIGKYREGWTDYECRWDEENDPSERPRIDAPDWRGEALDGQHLLVDSEQGLGDVIQFARYLPLLVKKGARVTFLAPPNLVRLLRPLTANVQVVTTIDEGAAFDFQCPLLGLPLRFQTDLLSIPDRVPYLAAEESRKLKWAERIGDAGFKVGVNWQGSPSGTVDGSGRSIRLLEFLPLFRIPGVRIISLQKQYGLEQLERLPPGMTVETLGQEFDSGPDAFVDTAAVVSHLDLVVTCDTSVAHLAGALGRPTWVALKYIPDWRWLLDREDTPWYPTMRLFRQNEDGCWASVFAQIANALHRIVR